MRSLDDPSAKRTPSTRLLKHHILPSDRHQFIGRIWDLSVVGYHFDTYADLSKHADCKYAIDVNEQLRLLVRRVESLNLVGNMLWPDPIPTAKALPVSLYEWLTASDDVFLTRFVSVVDCSLQLVNAVYESGLPPQNCKLNNLKRRGVSDEVVSHVGMMLDAQVRLRGERNARIHQGMERDYTQDDQTFRIAAAFGRAQGMTGRDRNGRPANVDRSFREGLVHLQRDFNTATRTLVRHLDALYDRLWREFEARFGPRIAAATHGLNAGGRCIKHL